MRRGKYQISGEAGKKAQRDRVSRASKQRREQEERRRECNRVTEKEKRERTS